MTPIAPAQIATGGGSDGLEEAEVLIDEGQDHDPVEEEENPGHFGEENAEAVAGAVVDPIVDAENEEAFEEDEPVAHAAAGHHGEEVAQNEHHGSQAVCTVQQLFSRSLLMPCSHSGEEQSNCSCLEVDFRISRVLSWPSFNSHHWITDTVPLTYQQKWIVQCTNSK